ncbi:hypothetical protein BDV96DRAFT_323769 [Lophiotrema nucula]|uniref:Short-chain dehydrogenase/reductase family protein n=1 Tax=Lophiotrema nucula TaxID=690887 RepID=A0A6A5ZNA5_9PLEO|nr:hypothetical protein BDV96DRAFT_323769 [Lophiotrema nucula]
MPPASLDLPAHADPPFTRFRKSQFTKPVPTPRSLSLAGQTAIITGSNSGLGLECGRQFLALGLERLIMAVRRPDAGEKVAVALRSQYPKARVEVWTLDMASYDSIRSFAEKCNTIERLDVVILNSGLDKIQFDTVKATGHEEMFQVNYLSTVLLAILLLPVLKSRSPEGKPGRLSLVGSGLALSSRFTNRNAVPLIPSFDDPKGWGLDASNERYSLTKTLLLMFIFKLSSYVPSSDIICNVVDPALCKGSALHRPGHAPFLFRAIMVIVSMIAARSMEVGATCYVDAACVKGAESHGSFVCDWKVHAYHRMMYTEEGMMTTERLWAETLGELKFAGVDEILERMHKGLKA